MDIFFTSRWAAEDVYYSDRTTKKPKTTFSILAVHMLSQKEDISGLFVPTLSLPATQSARVVLFQTPTAIAT